MLHWLHAELQVMHPYPQLRRKHNFNQCTPNEQRNVITNAQMGFFNHRFKRCTIGIVVMSHFGIFYQQTGNSSSDCRSTRGPSYTQQINHLYKYFRISQSAVVILKIIPIILVWPNFCTVILCQAQYVCVGRRRTQAYLSAAVSPPEHTKKNNVSEHQDPANCSIYNEEFSSNLFYSPTFLWQH